MKAYRSKKAAFSLIELLVAMSISSFILLTCAWLLGNSSGSYTLIRSSIACDREARSAMSRLTTDLASAQYYQDILFEQSEVARSEDQLRFLTLKSPNEQSTPTYAGDLCAVNYEIRDLKISNKIVRCLVRGIRESKETFHALQSKNISTLFLENPALDEPIAFDVISFQAHPKRLDHDGVWQDWTPASSSKPEAIEIELVCVRPERAQQLQTSADWEKASQQIKDPTTAKRLKFHQHFKVYQGVLRYGNDTL